MAKKFVLNDYVYKLFEEAQSYIDDSIDPLGDGLIDGIGYLQKKVQPDSDLPAHFAERFRQLIADATSANAEQPGRNLLQTTIHKSRIKKRWRLASEVLHLKYALREFLAPEERTRAMIS